jgi:pimeloyl-ACP methyl ester carboxylesterase
MVAWVIGIALTSEGCVPSAMCDHMCVAEPSPRREPEQGDVMSLYFSEYGPPDAPTIVFLHGGGGAGWMWKPQVDALRDEYHLLVPDLPEQGGSADSGPFTMAYAAEQVASLIRRAGDVPVHLVGLSEGAQVVVQMLATEPELVETAIVSSALVRPIPGTSAMSSPGLLKWTYRLSVAPFRNADWWIRWNMRSAAGVPDEYFAQFRESFRTLSESGFVDLMAANQSFRLPEGLGGATARVLAVCGAGEYPAMKLSAEDIAAAIPGAMVREVNHPAGTALAKQHNWNMTEPALFTAMVRAWIEGTPLPERLAELKV